MAVQDRPRAAIDLSPTGAFGGRDVTASGVAALDRTGMDDAALIARVLDGDAGAFTVIVDRYHRDCSRFALRMLGHRQDAEDALQDTFLSAYRGLARYRERQTF